MSNGAMNESTSCLDDPDVLTRSVAPSHILQDGRFIHLPPPSNAERGRFLERAIAKHGLLRDDMCDGTQRHDDEEEKDNEKESKKEGDSLKIHPLAVASARLNAQGIEELSKAINLSGLVSAGEYFGLSNIVDPNLELLNDKKKDDSTTTTKTTTSTATPLSSTSAADTSLRSTFLGKRKRSQFLAATEFLQQQSQRLASAVTAQSVMDDRLMQLRKRWRLVAPEHGTRAKPHPVQPHEVVAMDVHVYDRDRTGGGNLALKKENAGTKGRIARRVPRYATVELQESFPVAQHVQAWKEPAETTPRDNKKEDKDKATTDDSSSQYTRCEPFAVADPTLGKINVDFDPDKVPMLTLELTIAKASTGFQQSLCLSPMMAGSNSQQHQDEQVVVALQHSLFCASLFESIRPELEGSQCVWLVSEGDESFLPPPSQMAGSTFHGEIASLCVVHCHEGEVKVQLDSEYVLTVKLVEAGTAVRDVKTDNDPMQIETRANTTKNNSGSLSPQELLVSCRALLLHIQTVYHNHCMKLESAARLREKQTSTATGLARIKKEDEVLPPPHILQSGVSLGAKMLLEGKVRRALKRLVGWLKHDLQSNERLSVEWLPLSVFDLKSQFALLFQDLLVDVSIDHDGICVTSCRQEEYKSVTFISDVEFELFVKLEIQKRMKAKI